MTSATASTLMKDMSMVQSSRTYSGRQRQSTHKATRAMTVLGPTPWGSPPEKTRQQADRPTTMPSTEIRFMYRFVSRSKFVRLRALKV